MAKDGFGKTPEQCAAFELGDEVATAIFNELYAAQGKAFDAAAQQKLQRQKNRRRRFH